MKRKRADRRPGSKGFTLVELIVVLVVLGILAAILIPSMIGWIDKAKEKSVVLDCRNVVLAAQSKAVEEYAAGTALGTPMDSQLNAMAGEILKLAGVGGTIKAGSIRTNGTSTAVSELALVKDAYTIRYDITHAPVYWIDKGGYTASTGKDHSQSLTDQMTNDGLMSDGKIDEDKLKEWLKETNSTSNNNSQTVQEYFWEMMGSKEFPSMTAEEKKELRRLLSAYTPPLTVNDTAMNGLIWKPMVTSSGEVLLVAGSNNTGKGNILGCFIYYNGNYYGKLNSGGTAITTKYVPDNGTFSTDNLKENYEKDQWVKLGS